MKSCLITTAYLVGKLWLDLTSVGAFKTTALYSIQLRKTGLTKREPLAASTTIDKDLSSLPLPPHRKPGPFRNIRDTISFLVDPHKFTVTCAKELGPVYLTHQFFKPIVVVGGREAVKEFISGKELSSEVVYSALPDQFKELHTKWGTLNMNANDELFKESRKMFADALQSNEALQHHTEYINQELDKYMADLERRITENPEKPIFLVPELTSLCLQIFSTIFSGEGLTKEQEQLFIDYNAGLLTISKKSNKFVKGAEALNTLKSEMETRYLRLDATVGQLNKNPGQFFHDILYNLEGYKNNYDRISSVTLLFIWGAYIECAALMIDAMLISKKDPETLSRVLDEYRSRLATFHPESSYKFWSGMPYTLGVVRESLRLIPPGGGTPRFSTKDFELQGYRIPANTAVVMDPRIGNSDPELFKNPEEFRPIRWVPANQDDTSSKCPFRGTALNKGSGSWFPGGYGAHQCPGLPVAELISKMFLIKMANRFTSWECSGSGLTRKGEVKYNEIPIKIPVDELGLVIRK